MGGRGDLPLLLNNLALPFSASALARRPERTELLQQTRESIVAVTMVNWNERGGKNGLFRRHTVSAGCRLTHLKRMKDGQNEPSRQI